LAVALAVMEKVVPWGALEVHPKRHSAALHRRSFDQSKFELMIDGANVLTPSVDFREPPRQQNPFAVVEDGTARRERQWSALAGEGERSTDLFSVTGDTTKRESARRHTKRS
jgi:hypothetical protein